MRELFGKTQRRLLRLALATFAAVLLMASTAAAADDPIVSIGGNNPTLSASAGSDGTADACVGDQHSGVNDPNLVSLSDSTCTAGSGSSGTAGSQSGSGTTGTRSPSSAASRTGSTGTRAGAGTVAATGAFGLRIASVRVLLTDVRATKRFRVIVTLRDLRGRLVRGAIVTVGRVPGAVNTIRTKDADFTNRGGRARLDAYVAKKQLGTRVTMSIAARTPKARALQLRSVFLPGL